MQSLKCPQCNLVNFATAENCKRCGSSLVISHQTQPLVKPADDFPQPFQQQTISTTCPRCNSTDSQSYPMAYQAGTSFGNIKAASYTFNVGATVTGGTVSNQTILANNLKPPTAPSSNNGCITTLLSCIIVIIVVNIFSAISSNLAALLGLVTLGFCIYYFNKSFSASEKVRGYEYQKAMAKWSRSWICLRCGASWTL